MVVRVIKLESFDVKITKERKECYYSDYQGHLSKDHFYYSETLFSDKNANSYSNRLPSVLFDEDILPEEKHISSKYSDTWHFKKFTQVGQFSVYRVSLERQGGYVCDRLIIVVDNHGYVIYTEEEKEYDYVLETTLINDHLLELVQVGRGYCKYKHISYVSDKEGLVLHYKTERDLCKRFQVSLPNSVLLFIDDLWLEYDMQMELIQKHYEWQGLFCDCKIYDDYHVLNLHNEREGRGILYKGDLIVCGLSECISNFGRIEDTDMHYFITNNKSSFNSESYDVHILKGSRYLFTLYKVEIPRAWYDYLSESFIAHVFSNGLQVAYVTNPITQKRSYGLIDEDLNIVLPFTMDSIRLCKNGKSIVESNGEFGIADRDGKIIINPIYSSCKEKDNFFIGTFEDGSYLIDSQWSNSLEATGRIRIVHQPFYDNNYKYERESELREHLQYKEGLEIICIEGDYSVNENYNEVKEVDGLRFGLIDFNGRIIIEPKYTYLGFVDVPEESMVNKFKVQGMCFSTSGESVVEGDSAGYLKSHDGQVGFMDLSGNVIIPDIYDSFRVFDKYIRTRKDGLYGLYDVNGRQYLENIYTFVSLMAIGGKTSMACYMVGGEIESECDVERLYPFFDRAYNINIEFNPPRNVSSLYCSNTYGYREHMFTRKLEDYISAGKQKARITGAKYGFCNLMTGVKSQSLYDEAHRFRGKYAAAKRDERYYLIDWSLQEIQQLEGLPGGYTRYDSSQGWVYAHQEDEYERDSYIEDGYREAYNGDYDSIWNTD
ncbi:MAG: WG repeat-containing protein [Bacteroidales bacterium]|nr:WG repeat-containing protein [Bacteroidales bacterium]